MKRIYVLLLCQACASSPASTRPASNIRPGPVAPTGTPPAAKASETTAINPKALLPPNFTWRESLPIRSMSAGNGTIGGTELRAIVAFDNKLFAANGYWEDSEKGSSTLPGAQIFRLDSPTAEWKVDYQVREAAPNGQPLYFSFASLEKVTFTVDDKGARLSKPVSMLLAGMWKTGSPNVDVFSRHEGAGSWTGATIPVTQTPLPTGQQIRAFATHIDSATKKEWAFAGAENAIYVGQYNQAANNVVWRGTPEWQGDLTGKGSTIRVLSFAEANGKLYAGVNGSLLERQDAASPTWKTVAQTPIHSAGAEGMRGITTIRNPHGQGEALLVPVEDTPGRIYVVDPTERDASTGLSRMTEDLNISDFMATELGKKITYVVPSYNHTTELPDPSGTCPGQLIGIHLNTPGASLRWGSKVPEDPNAYFLVRDCHGNYTSQLIRDNSINPAPILEAVRSLSLSPFPTDPQGTIYAGGFDTTSNSVHNTAWLYKGSLSASNVKVGSCSTDRAHTCAQVMHPDGSLKEVLLASEIVHPVQSDKMGAFAIPTGSLGYYFIDVVDGNGVPSIYVLDLDKDSVVAHTTVPSGHTMFDTQFGTLSDKGGKTYPYIAPAAPNNLSAMAGANATSAPWGFRCLFDPHHFPAPDPLCMTGFTKVDELPSAPLRGN